jgi:hypothetical protein
MPAFWSTNWTGKPELHKIVNVDDGRTHYFFDQAPKARTIEESGFDDDHPGLTRTRQLTGDDGGPSYEDGGYYSGTDINKVRQEWQRQFPGVAFPAASTATPGAGINAQGNGIPGQFSGREYTERGNAGHGSWWDQQGTELMGDALFAGAGYAGGGLAGAMMSYGLGGDTSAESQRSLRAGAAGGLVGSIFGTPSTTASNTPSDASGVPAEGTPSGTISGSEGNPAMTGSTGNDTLPGSDPYGTGVDQYGNPTGQYANGTGNSLNLGNSSLWGQVLGAGVGAAANIYSANKAANLQTEAGKESNATQLAMFNQARSDLEPWRTAGEGALGQLTQGIKPGGDLVRRFTMADFENDPVTQASFRYGLDEGTKGINRTFGARGMSKSGAAIKALDRFTADYVGSKAGDSYNRFVGDQSNVYNRLAGVAGTGQTSAAQTANLGVATGANIGNTLEGIANARGAASIATGNAVSNAAANIGNAYQTQSYLEALNKRQPTTNNYYYTMGM